MFRDDNLFIRFMFNISAEVVDSWFFMSSIKPMMWLFVFYLCSVKFFLPRKMRNRKAFDLSMATRAYNILQVIACAWSVSEFFRFGFTFPQTLHCTNLLSAENHSGILRVWWFCLMIRVAELSETLVFILRKKTNQVSPLHLYHHMSTIFIVWLALKFDGRKLSH